MFSVYIYIYIFLRNLALAVEKLSTFSSDKNFYDRLIFSTNRTNKNLVAPPFENIFIIDCVRATIILNNSKDRRAITECRNARIFLNSVG